MSLKEKDDGLNQRLSLLMDKYTNDFNVDSYILKTLSKVKMVADELDITSALPESKSITEDDILHCLGMKNINAYNLSTVGSLKGTALYPTYSLINSNCNSNTRYLFDTKYVVLCIFYLYFVIF